MIIGFAGKKGSGKSTAAEYLKFEYGFLHVNFADKVKQIAMDVYGLSRQQVYGTPEQKELIDARWGVSPRFIMQRIGAEMGRNIHADTWVNYLFHRVIFNSKTQGYRDFVISDVRYANEAEKIKNEKGIIVQIIRPELMDDGDSHSSEIGLEDRLIDMKIHNNGTLKDFKKLIDRFMDDLRFKDERNNC